MEPVLTTKTSFYYRASLQWPKTFSLIPTLSFPLRNKLISLIQILLRWIHLKMLREASCFRLSKIDFTLSLYFKSLSFVITFIYRSGKLARETFFKKHINWSWVWPIQRAVRMYTEYSFYKTNETLRWRWPSFLEIDSELIKWRSEVLPVWEAWRETDVRDSEQNDLMQLYLEEISL